MRVRTRARARARLRADARVRACAADRGLASPEREELDGVRLVAAHGRVGARANVDELSLIHI
eukprot:4323604-Pleurochrysis_carterae.AAC.1